jgi:hypothetical protein
LTSKVKERRRVEQHSTVFVTSKTHLDRIKFLSSFCCRHHMNNLIVAIISKFHVIPVICFHNVFPFFFGNNWKISKIIKNLRRILKEELTCWSIHGTSITNYETISFAGSSKFKEGVFDLYHRLEKVLLKSDGWNGNYSLLKFLLKELNVERCASKMCITILTSIYTLNWIFDKIF